MDIPLDQKEKKEKFTALPMYVNRMIEREKRDIKSSSYHRLVINSRLIGSSRDQRQSELFEAVTRANLTRVRCILSQGCDVNGKNEYGETPLFLACWYVFSILIEIDNCFV